MSLGLVASNQEQAPIIKRGYTVKYSSQTFFTSFLNMLLSTFLFLVSTALANPVLLKREPSDKSGTSILEFHCSSATIPNPGGANGEGEGGTGLFNADMKFKIRGTEVKPDSCTEQKGYCSTCTYKGNGLKEDITAKGCNNPMVCKHCVGCTRRAN